MKEKIENIAQELEGFSSHTTDEIENFRIKILGKKGSLTVLFDEFKNVAPEEKRLYGKPLNDLKQKALEKIAVLKELSQSKNGKENKAIDLTLPAEPQKMGSRHPINLVRREIIDIFNRIGYTLAEGPEIEDDFHNFTALNFPPEHPARDMQDTFFVNGENYLLRTHTSSVQVRVMENSQPPIRCISPGRVYRNEAVSARAHCFFHQLEALYVDKSVSFADLKQTLLYFAREMFGEKTEIRLRPSYFPFTEPSAEVDVSCMLCKGKGCNVCKHTGFLEILGCGMVHPNVLENCGIDSSVYSGFAIGMGLERIAMLKYDVKDLRLFSENDVRFLRQFSTII